MSLLGGLDGTLSAVLRRAFASRLAPPSAAKALGVRHVRGLLLHGPPGTGKTLVARRLAELLRAKPPKLATAVGWVVASSEPDAADPLAAAGVTWNGEPSPAGSLFPLDEHLVSYSLTADLGTPPDATCYERLRHDRKRVIDAPCPLQPGLAVLTSLGSRGLSAAPLAAQVLTDQMLGTPPAVPRYLQRAISPARFAERALKRGEPL